MRSSKPQMKLFGSASADGRLVPNPVSTPCFTSAEALPNSFIWGLDDRIHGVTAGIGGLIVASNWPAGPVSLAGSDFSLEPRTLEVRPEAGPSQSGLTFDSHGRRYVSD